MSVRAVGAFLALVLALSVGAGTPARAQDTACDESLPLDECLLEAELLGAVLNEEAFKAEVLRRLNEKRAATINPLTNQPLPPLVRVEVLEGVAQGYSEEWRKYIGGNGLPAGMDHVGPYGSTLADRIAGYTGTGRSWDENLAYGHLWPQEVVDRWWNSPIHHPAIVRDYGNVTEVGIGLASGPAAGDSLLLWWTVVYAGNADTMHTVRPTTPGPVPDPKALLRQAEEAYCKGDHQSFETAFYKFIELWVQLELPDTHPKMTQTVGKCLEDWLGLHGEDKIESDLVKGFRTGDP